MASECRKRSRDGSEDTDSATSSDSESEYERVHYHGPPDNAKRAAWHKERRKLHEREEREKLKMFIMWLMLQTPLGTMPAKPTRRYAMRQAMWYTAAFVRQAQNAGRLPRLDYSQSLLSAVLAPDDAAKYLDELASLVPGDALKLDFDEFDYEFCDDEHDGKLGSTDVAGEADFVSLMNSAFTESQRGRALGKENVDPMSRVVRRVVVPPMPDYLPGSAAHACPAPPPPVPATRVPHVPKIGCEPRVDALAKSVAIKMEDLY